MSARVLIVDDLAANRRVLAAKLAQDYHTVFEAANGRMAIEIARADPPDIVLLDVMMPGLDGYAVCETLKDDPVTRHVPIVMVSSLDDKIDRMRGFEVGADDFLSKPVDTAQLLARVRSLARLKLVVDELRAREASGRRLGAIEGEWRKDAGLGATLLVIDDDRRELDFIERALSASHTVMRPNAADQTAPPELVLAAATAKAFDGLSLIARLASDPATRALPILAIADPDDVKQALRALDLGAHDLIYRPLDADELAARVRAIVRRKRQLQALRAALDHGMEMAVTDQLTGLHNRRFALSQLTAMVARANEGGAPASVLLMDIDHFKRINDTHGHDAGDAVLREFAARLASAFRAVDVTSRHGGEEFLAVLPGTTADVAVHVADRFRRNLAAAPIPLRDDKEHLSVTVSIGVATTQPTDTAESLLKRADMALYRAKSSGRNRVIGPDTSLDHAGPGPAT